MKNLILRRGAVAFAGIAIAAGWMAYAVSRSEPLSSQSRFRSGVVDTGSITHTVTATGTINPAVLINVGSQTSGTVVGLYADFNDRVKRGQVLLKLDPTIFNAQIGQAEAGLASANASLRLARANFERNRRLVADSYLSAVTLDQSRRELDLAEANIDLALANLARARADLNNSVIRSPIDGIVVKRTIELGQTVAASFTTPNLFQVAGDLSRMQIDASVSEADVAALRDGQQARFVVDAYPDREFEAKMRQFRMAPNVVQNVVTYAAVLDFDNHERLLKPGMTAQVRLVVADRADVLRIPTAALRFRMSDDEQEHAASKGNAKNDGALAAGAGPAPDPGHAFPGNGETKRRVKVYKLRELNEPEPVDIQIGLSNFRHTEVLAGRLKRGDKVITRASRKDQERSHEFARQ